MNNTYFELIDQTHDFPQEGFDLIENQLYFNDIDLKNIIEKYNSPLKITYLPKIRQQIKKARSYFQNAFNKFNYSGNYEFCYCTKSSHFHHVVSTALKEEVSLETSSSFDIDLIKNLHSKGALNEQTTIIHNGYKTEKYLAKINELISLGFENCIIVLDNMGELTKLNMLNHEFPLKIGLRVCIEEEPQATYYTSRMGINKNKILDFVDGHLAGNSRYELRMLHFFIDSGISDTFYYWGELQKVLNLYTSLKERVPSLHSLNIGGGFPIRNRLNLDYDYQSMVDQIIQTIKEYCNTSGIEHPDIYTEFGKFTVGESGAVIFKVLEQKQQNETELWYIIDNSLINTIPDAWTINEKFILLPINKWDHPYRRVNIGGISCDSSDYYNSEQLNQPILLPSYQDDEEEPLYIGFFHTGAYQDAISGYGGIKHCLIPSPKHVVVDKDENGQLTDYLYRTEQTVDNMLNILGYND